LYGYSDLPGHNIKEKQLPEEMIFLKKFIEKVEKYLIRTIALAFAALIIVQGLMTHDNMRLYLSWGERLEGQAIEFPVNAVEQENNKDLLENVNSPYAVIVLSVEKYSSLPKAAVLVNGEKKEAFDGSEVQLKLMAGDVVEIDASAYSFPVEFKVKSVSDNLAFPAAGEKYVCSHDVVMIGKVVVK